MPPFAHLYLQPDDFLIQPRQILRTITAPGGLTTSTITLAPGDSTPTPQITTTPLASTTSTPLPLTTTTPSLATPTIFTAAPSSGPSQSVVLGAILGTLSAFIVLFVISCWCCYSRSARRCWPIWSYDSDTDSGYGYGSSSYGSGSERSRVRRRGGWLGSDVRRPERARVRARRSSSGYGGGSRRESVVFERQKRRSSHDRPPLFNFLWFGADKHGPRSEVRNLHRPRSARRESQVGRGFVVDD